MENDQPSDAPSAPPPAPLRLPAKYLDEGQVVKRTRWLVTSISPDGPTAIEVDTSMDLPPPMGKYFTVYRQAAVRKNQAGAVTVFPFPLDVDRMVKATKHWNPETCAYFVKPEKALLDLIEEAYRSPGHQAPKKEEPKGPKLVVGTERDLKAIDAAAKGGQP